MVHRPTRKIFKPSEANDKVFAHPLCLDIVMIRQRLYDYTLSIYPVLWRNFMLFISHSQNLHVHLRWTFPLLVNNIEDNIGMDAGEIGLGRMDWMGLA
jgi:hypothetical protein